MVNLCTLFDSNYLDRGIVLYKSLEKNAENFHLYILCFDEKAYDVLNGLRLRHATVIPEREIMTEELESIKAARTRAEYCWTCTPIVVQYVLENYAVADCTYIDADMFFYSDPQILLDELYANGASVGIIEHRFPNDIAKKQREMFYGKYCVEFNTFCNDEIGQKVLKYWRARCFEQCTMAFGNESFGDQKYVEEWEEKFRGVYVYQHLGAGVAPWNICDYRMANTEKGIALLYKKKNLVELVFYHFQNLMILDGNKVFIGVYNELGHKDKQLIKKLYEAYVLALRKARRELKEMGAEIPVQQFRKGKKSSGLKMKFVDFVIYAYQCMSSVLHRKKNFINL